MNTTKAEKISVILTAYNHEAFIKESIESILNQSYENFELIIVDDGSVDKTRKIIDEYEDSRIRKIFKYNEGPSVAVNLAVNHAKGNWIALMSGDDVSKPNRLEIEYKIATQHDIDFVFSKPELINDKGIKLNESVFPFFFIDVPDQEGSIFRKMFYEGNFICAPSAFMRKEAYLSLGGFKETSLQLQDYMLWIEALKQYRIKISDARLISYRLHEDNLSGVKKNIRINFENMQVYRTFFDNTTWTFLKPLFSEISFYSCDDEDLLEIEKSFIYVNHPDPLVKMIGAERLFEKMSCADSRTKIEKYKHFYLKDFFRLTDEIDLSQRYMR